MRISNFQFPIFKKSRALVLISLGLYSAFLNSASAETFSVIADTQGNTVNAVSGSLVLPASASVKEIQTGNSAILIWLEKPRFENHAIRFAGLTPGGFKGTYPLFAFETEARSLPADFQGVEAYLNDGAGTKVPVSLRLEKTAFSADTEVPEPYELSVSRSPGIFEGRPFLSFAAQDKGTGIERYEFASTWFLNPSEESWLEAQSPRALSSIESFKRLHVRAVDHNGYSRTVSTSGPYFYLTIFFGLIMLSCLAFCLKRSLSRLP